MLELMMQEIRAGGTLETHQLADKLGASVPMVAAMLAHLERAGLISAYQGCDSGCDGCGLKSGCHVGGKAQRVQIWQLVTRE